MRTLPPLFLLPLLILAFFLTPGCVSIDNVGKGEFQHKTKPNHKGEVIVVSQARKYTRVGPMTKVRFWRSDGSLTPWVNASRLTIDEQSLFMKHRIPFHMIDAVRVGRLKPRDLTFLEESAPGGCSLRDDGDERVLLEGCEDQWGEWLNTYLVGVHEGWKNVPGYRTIEECCVDNPNQSCQTTNPWHESTMHLQCNQRLRGLQQWGFHVKGLGWIDGYSDPSLNTIIEAGLEYEAGLRFADISSVEVHNAGLLPGDSSDIAPGPEEIGLWAPGFESPAPVPGGGPLFDGRTQRRGAALFVLSTTFGSGFVSPHAADGSTAAVLRFGRLVDIGGGYSQLVALGDDDAREHIHSGFLRVGFHLDIDPRRRFALPLFLDIHFTSKVETLLRYNAGLRWHIGRGVHLGAFPFNPQKLTVNEDYTGALVSGWTFPSRLEVSLSF